MPIPRPAASPTCHPDPAVTAAIAAAIQEILSGYPEPTFDETLSLCRGLGLVHSYERAGEGVRMRFVSEWFEGPSDQALLVMKGMLLGYYYAQVGDSMSGARWIA